MAAEFDLWLNAEGVSDFDTLRKLLLIEQIMRSYGVDERIHVRQSGATSWEHVVSALHSFVSARTYYKKEGTRNRPSSTSK